MDRRVILPKAGGWNVFEIDEFKLLDPTEDEVQVSIHFSGLNFADIHMRQGLYPEAPKFPFSPGYEFSGVVTKVGSSVTEFSVGDKVFGGNAFYCYQSKINVSKKQVLYLPADYSLEEGAGLLVSFVTAYIAIVEQGRVRSGETAFIDCISGSLGHACNTILKEIGVKIHGGTSSKKKIAFIKEMGAIPHIHKEIYKSKELTFDFILNSQGGKTVMKHYKKLNPVGRMICLGASSGIAKGKRNLIKALLMFFSMPKYSVVDLMNDNKSVGGVNVLKLFDDIDYLMKCASNFNTFNYRPRIDKVFEAKNIGEAQKYIEEKKSKGKVLISW